MSFPTGLKNSDLGDLRAKFSPEFPGWDGSEFEPWRVTSMTAWMHAMQQERHAYRDWLKGIVILEFLKHVSADLTVFWTRDVSAANLPRHWLRFSFEHQQRFHKVNDGTPADAQIGTYLVDADHVLSADKNFIRFAARSREEAPFSMAEARLVPSGSGAVSTVLSLLQS